MPYRATPIFSGGYYHIYNRGNNRQPIFFEEENYFYFLHQLQKYFPPEKIELVAYCLMPNHYHLIIGMLSDDLSSLMQPFILSYSKAIGKRFGRVGSLFQGPFKSILIETYEYLLHLSRYVHLNPVTAGLVRRPEEWAFSSYCNYTGGQGIIPVKADIILTQLGVEFYPKFVMEYQTEDFEKISSLTLE